MRLKDKILNKKVVILGGGFRSLITAAFCLDYTKNITIISRDEKNFHGVMSPIKVFGGNFDKGYQFFDGFSEENKLFLEKIIGKNVLYDYGYGASSFTNNKIFPQHGIPYWPHESKILALKSFFFIGQLSKSFSSIGLHCPPHTSDVPPNFLILEVVKSLYLSPTTFPFKNNSESGLLSRLPASKIIDLILFFSNFNAVDIPAGPLPIITTKNLLLIISNGLLTIIVFNKPNF